MMADQRDGLSREEIVAALHALGLHPGAMVLVHSSLRSLGWVRGGAATVIDALLAAVTPGGTVCVPTLTGTPRDRPNHPPVFDPRTSPCWTGTIPETLWRRPEARRGAHATHSVAGIGPAIDALIAGHEYCPTPCAAGSPYGRLAEHGGVILLLGVTHECNTSLHMVEEVAGVPYVVQDLLTPTRVVRPDGRHEVISTRLHSWQWERDFPRIEPLLREAGVQRDGLIGQAHCRLVEARGMRDLLLPLLHDDPLFLLADEARAAYLAGGTS